MQWYLVIIDVCLLALANGIPLQPRDTNHNGYLRMTLNHHHSTSSHGFVSPKLTNTTANQAIAPSILTNHISYYSVDLTIGTPPQTFSVDVDTGSSDLWVLDSRTGKSPAFNTEESSTFKTIDEKFQISYLQGEAEGEWATDTIGISGATLQNQQFAVAQRPNDGKGILGVGMQGLESTKNKYTNIPQNLVDQGFIYHNAYSLFLDDIESSTGSILFGGIQPNKYDGQLFTIPMLSESTISIQVDGLIAGEDTAIAIPDGNFATLLDSGTSLTYLEDSLVAGIAQRLGCEYSEHQGAYFCDNREDTSTVTYEFSGAQITVPSTEALIDGSIYGGDNAPKEYMLTIVPYSQSSNYTILGDTFLRSVYAVFDLENHEVSLAQSSYDQADGCVQVINGQVPGAIRAPDYK